MLGAHNTLSAYGPKKWWAYPLLPFAKCQTKNFEQLYEAGVRMYDIRVNFDSEGGAHFMHGIVEWNIDKATLLEKLWELDQKSTKEDPVYIRVILEFNKEPKDIEYQLEKFSEFCQMLVNLCQNCKFFNFRVKYDWKPIKITTEKDLKTLDVYSSPNWKSIFQTFTMLYAFIYNSFTRKFLEDKINSKGTVVMMDFV